MSSLQLNIDALKFPDVPESDKYISKPRKLSNLVRNKLAKPAGTKSTTVALPAVPKKHTPDQWHIFQALNDFLQPGSSVTLFEAVKKVVDVFPDGSPDFKSLNHVATELAEQIPYHHPSQIKLVRLICYFGRSEERMRKYHNKDPVPASQMFYQDLWENVVDNYREPGVDGADLSRFVNFQAFQANLVASDIHLPGYLRTLEDAFDEQQRNSDEPEVRDAWVMGAAQCILWWGQGLYKEVLCPYIEDLNDKSYPPRGPTLQRWHEWATGFRQAAQREGAGKESRQVAGRAADMMEVIERCMFGLSH